MTFLKFDLKENAQEIAQATLRECIPQFFSLCDFDSLGEGPEFAAACRRWRLAAVSDVAAFSNLEI